VIFMNEPSDKSAYYLSESKYSVCVLNFADPTDAGGLYTIGYETQEEELCRTIPALYDSLKDSKAYPINCYTNVLYTPDLLVYRDSKDNYNRYKTPLVVSVVSASAPNIATTTFDKQKVYDIMKMLFYTPKMYDKNKTAIVLGAWGCGSHGCDPKVIAKLFHRLIEGHKNIYKLICFSLPPGDIYNIFLEAFGRKPSY
jgi:uncharacterized protein (TIGR02452 family)